MSKMVQDRPIEEHQPNDRFVIRKRPLAKDTMNDRFWPIPAVASEAKRRLVSLI